MRKDKDLAFILNFENVAWYEKGQVKILDRRIYPMKTEFVVCKNHKEVAKAITDMVTQSGGPFRAAYMGMALAAYECKDMKMEIQDEYLRQAAYDIGNARPTTSKEMEKITGECLITALKALREGKKADEAVFQLALDYCNSMIDYYDQVAEHLHNKIPDRGTIMTQCFGETIVGTLLRKCREKGNEIKVICPETRPYFQGARLTASVVKDMGFQVHIITDNMPAFILKEKNVDLFTSAADIITGDGHIVNKVGTFGIALAANYHEIPYYATGEISQSHKSLESVKIEERDPKDVLNIFGKRIAMEGVEAYYPAFDITPPELCTGIVTSEGIINPTTLR